MTGNIIISRITTKVLIKEDYSNEKENSKKVQIDLTCIVRGGIKDFIF